MLLKLIKIKQLKVTSNNIEKSKLYTKLGDLYLSIGGLEWSRLFYKRAFIEDSSNSYAEMNYYKLGLIGIVDLEEWDEIMDWGEVKLWRKGSLEFILIY